jgi:hypothetical protein
MELFCAKCNERFSGVTDLSKHISTHRISQKRYFEEHFPRKDLSNGSIISFKSLEQYFLSDFVDKTSMKKWLADSGKEKAANYIAAKLKKYCDLKKMQFAPPEFFIQTIGFLPSIRFIEKLTGLNYNQICEKSGVETIFNYSNLVERINKYKQVKQIVVDTREKKPLSFGKEFRRVEMCLSYGDYALSPNSKTVIERKSFGDFFGTIGPGLERFEREMTRAKEDGGYIIIMIESTYSSLAHRNIRWGKANPEYIFHRLRDLYKKFDCFQVVFCDGRTQMKTLIPKLLGVGDEIRKIDIQHCIDTKII